MKTWEKVLLILLIPTHHAYADAVQSLFLGPRALAMGGAFVAVADDEQAIFYNPAGLAGVKDVSILVAGATAQLSNDLINNFPLFSNSLSNPSLSTVSTLVGKNLTTRVQGMTSILAPNFGIAGIYNTELSIQAQNLSLPQGNFGYLSTYGVQTGFGWTLKRFKKKRGEIRMGIGAKMLWRSGGFSSLSLSELLTLNYKSLTSSLPGLGMGYGLDGGFQSVYNLSKKFTFLGGLSVTNIGNTSFASGSPPLDQNVTMGAAARYTGSDVTTTLSFDYAHLLQPVDWREKVHLGLEFKMPLLSLYTGLNQLHPTYGAGLNLFMFKVMYVSYAEDQTALLGQNTERRQMVYVALKFDL